MNEKCTTDQNNGMAERHKEQPDVNDQGRLSLSTDGDKCAMVNFGGGE